MGEHGLPSCHRALLGCADNESIDWSNPECRCYCFACHSLLVGEDYHPSEWHVPEDTRLNGSVDEAGAYQQLAFKSSCHPVLFAVSGLFTAKFFITSDMASCVFVYSRPWQMSSQRSCSSIRH